MIDAMHYSVYGTFLGGVRERGAEWGWERTWGLNLTRIYVRSSSW